MGGAPVRHDGDVVTAGPPLAASPRRHLGLALAIISAAQLMVMLDLTIVNVTLPSIQRSLAFSPTSLEWVVTTYALTFGGLLLAIRRRDDGGVAPALQDPSRRLRRPSEFLLRARGRGRVSVRLRPLGRYRRSLTAGSLIAGAGPCSHRRGLPGRRQGSG